MIRYALLFFVCMLTYTSSFADGADGPDLELHCPCSISNTSDTAGQVVFGVENISSSSTGELRVEIYVHPEPHYFEAESPQYIGEVPVSDSLSAGESIDNQAFSFGIFESEPGTYYVTIMLVENNSIADLVRTSKTIEIVETSGRSFSALFFDSDASMDITGAEVTVTLPSIVNAGTEDKNLKVLLVANSTEDFFGSAYYTIAEINIDFISAGSQSAAGTPTFSYTAPPSGNDYYHLVVIDSDSQFTQLVELVQGPTLPGSISWQAESIDFLTDSDGDGVSDDNEVVAGSDPAIASSTPGKSFIDVLILYAEEVADYYEGDPSARIDHLVAVTNQSLADSGIDIEIRVAGSQQYEMDESQTLAEWLNDAAEQSGAFTGLQDVRDSVGADLIAMMRIFDDGNFCGRAELGGFARQGDLTRDAHISVNFIDALNCEDSILAHEIGHNLGLGHSFVQGETGTFDWSRGHGESSEFSTIMAYADAFNNAQPVPLFSNPDISLCNGSACGVSIGAEGEASAAKSLNTVRFRAAAFTASVAADSDSDGVPDDADAFPDDAAESADSDGDGVGNNADHDDDNDGMPDPYELFAGHDPLVADASADDDLDGATNAEEYAAVPRARQYLQTTSASVNVTNVNIVNTSGVAQSFVGNLFDGAGQRIGAVNQSLGDPVAPFGRLILDAFDIQSLFGANTWSGPAMLEVRGTESFDLMAKLVSPSGLISNTNCVTERYALNIEGAGSGVRTFVRFINTSNDKIGPIVGTLYDANGDAIGASGVTLVSELMPKAATFINRDQFEALVDASWSGEAMLEVEEVDGLKLLNLNFVNEETFFNFSCFESGDGSGTVYLQTTSASINDSRTHLVNTDNTPQTFTGTLYNSEGNRLGNANQVLHADTIAPRGRVILSSGNIEDIFGVPPWSGPAVLEVTSAGRFELMTKLTSPSGLISNTNCVRTAEAHNIEPPGSSERTFVRFINTSPKALGPVSATLYDRNGTPIGNENQTVLDSMAGKAQTFVARDTLADIFDTWSEEASLVTDGPETLKLLNLNFVNEETFFNFSCYDSSEE